MSSATIMHRNAAERTSAGSFAIQKIHLRAAHWGWCPPPASPALAPEAAAPASKPNRDDWPQRELPVLSPRKQRSSTSPAKLDHRPLHPHTSPVAIESPPSPCSRAPPSVATPSALSAAPGSSRTAASPLLPPAPLPTRPVMRRASSSPAEIFPAPSPASPSSQRPVPGTRLSPVLPRPSSSTRSR